MTAFVMDRIPLWSLVLMVLYCGTAALAQNASEPEIRPIAMRATHLLGLEGARDNASGTLSIQGNALQFRKQRQARNIRLPQESSESNLRECHAVPPG